MALGSADALRHALGPGTTVDAKVGRQFSSAPAIVRSWVASHDGPVVVLLGSNGTVDADDLDSVLDAASGRTVVLVGVSVPRRWQDSNNAELRAAADRDAPRVRYADWPRVVEENPGLLGPDDVHPLPHGRTLLAGTVRDALTR